MTVTIFLTGAYLGLVLLVNSYLGSDGLLNTQWGEGNWIFLVGYILLASHLTITAMSLSFHRYHTHQGIILNGTVDMIMQIWLSLVTSMSKFDWVSVHRYHHLHSDQEKDPHSPVQRGFWHVFFLGVADYVEAKKSPEVMQLRKRMKGNRLERFIEKYTLVGPSIMTILCVIFLGPLWGSILAVIHFAITPLFAVGGVNALAHWIGYRNHHTKDNSKNIGFLFPLNFILCGELDHNNHHGQQYSCSFRHRWYEFDIGFVYIKILAFFKLAKICYAYTPSTLKQQLMSQLQHILEGDHRIKKRCEQLARELNTSYTELQKQISDYLQGKKVKLSAPVMELVAEIKRTMNANYRLSLSYS